MLANSSRPKPRVEYKVILMTRQRPPETIRYLEGYQVEQVEHHVRSSDDFYIGRRNADQDRAQAVAQYLQDWQRAWDQMMTAIGDGARKSCFLEAD